MLIHYASHFRLFSDAVCALLQPARPHSMSHVFADLVCGYCSAGSRWHVNNAQSKDATKNNRMSLSELQKWWDDQRKRLADGIGEKQILRKT